MNNAPLWLGRLLGRDDLTHIDEAHVAFGSSWAHGGPAWVLLAAAGLAGAAFYFYLRRQNVRTRTAIPLALLRSLVLGLLVLILAEPVLELRFTDRPKPLLWILADGSDSMNLVDDLSPGDRTRLNTAAGLPTGDASRADLVRGLLTRPDGPLAALSDTFRVQGFVFDTPDAVRRWELSDPASGASDPASGASNPANNPASGASNGPGNSATPTGTYTTTGTVTALGGALDDLRRRHPAQDLAGVVVLSDFVQNAGPPALPAAEKLGVPIFAVGYGSTAAADLAIDLDVEPTVKKAERVSFAAILRQTGLTGQSVTVTLSRAPADDSAEPVTVGEKTVPLDGPRAVAEFPLTPEEAGRYRYTASVAPLPGEAVTENNTATRGVTVTDDYLRLLFVEYEPTWEWRFVKEVFHRDRLVGMRGFRTYLRSSDPAVRRTNELFIEALPPPRDEFFQYDVIFLGDMPASALPGRFLEMTQEFVSQFGGGLVVIGGPRFGPQALAGTPVAEMLPVALDPDARRRDGEFRLRRTAAAAQFDFMRLGDSDAENQKAWENLGPLAWYQPVRRVESTAVVLAEHPTDTVADGVTKQPIIARRPYGAAGGEVVYVGTDETWRLRRLYGEKYYRQFWGQLIYRLGLGHARGADKRFVIDPLPETPFRPDDEVPITVRAWDRNFERLTQEDVAGGALTAELVRLGAGENETVSPLSLPMTRAGVFESRAPVYQPGEYRLRVTDPITSEVHEARFSVADVSAERRVATRDTALQTALAAAVPGGGAIEPDQLAAVLAAFDPPRRVRTTTDILPLWDSWLMFGLVVVLLLCEWLGRKAANLV